MICPSNRFRLSLFTASFPVLYTCTKKQHYPRCSLHGLWNSIRMRRCVVAVGFTNLTRRLRKPPIPGGPSLASSPAKERRVSVSDREASGRTLVRWSMQTPSGRCVGSGSRLCRTSATQQDTVINMCSVNHCSPLGSKTPIQGYGRQRKEPNGFATGGTVQGRSCSARRPVSHPAPLHSPPPLSTARARDTESHSSPQPAHTAPRPSPPTPHHAPARPHRTTPQPAHTAPRPSPPVPAPITAAGVHGAGLVVLHDAEPGSASTPPQPRQAPPAWLRLPGPAVPEPIGAREREVPRLRQPVGPCNDNENSIIAHVTF